MTFNINICENLALGFRVESEVGRKTDLKLRVYVIELSVFFLFIVCPLFLHNSLRS